MVSTSNKELPKDSTQKINSIDTLINGSSKKSSTGITFKITLKNTDYTNPSTIIQLVNNGKITIIATITGKAKITPASEYATMCIPSNAICGAWWADSGDYFYVISTKHGLEVYKGFEEEQQTDTGYH